MATDSEDQNEASENGKTGLAALPKKTHPMETLLKNLGGAIPFLKAGDIVEGTFLEKHGSNRPLEKNRVFRRAGRSFCAQRLLPQAPCV